MTAKANPPDLRRALEVAQVFVKHGILFVAVPVLHSRDHDHLLADVLARLKMIEEECES